MEEIPSGRVHHMPAKGDHKACSISSDGMLLGCALEVEVLAMPNTDWDPHPWLAGGPTEPRESPDAMPEGASLLELVLCPILVQVCMLQIIEWELGHEVLHILVGQQTTEGLTAWAWSGQDAS